MLAYLSGRVLGQYEVFSADPGQLLLVAPNIVEVERKLGADPRDFRLWVCLHEVTHRTQFTRCRGCAATSSARCRRSSTPRRPAASTCSSGCAGGSPRCPTSLRNPDSRASVLDIVQTPGQRAVLDRLTALMTLLEGHAEFVMDGVGPEVIPRVDEIRARFNRRRDAGNPLEKAIRRLLGIEVKMRQYAEGRKFVHGVVERVGMDGFNKIFSSPLTLPRLDELADPDAWVARVQPPSTRSEPCGRDRAAGRRDPRRGPLGARRARPGRSRPGSLLRRRRLAGARGGDRVRGAAARPAGRAGHRRPRTAGRLGGARRRGGGVGRVGSGSTRRWRSP